MALTLVVSVSVRKGLTSSGTVEVYCDGRVLLICSTSWLIIHLTLVATYAYSNSYSLVNECFIIVSSSSEPRNVSGSNKNGISSREKSLRIYLRDLSLFRSFSTSKIVTRCYRACSRLRTLVHDFGSLKRLLDFEGT